LSSCRSSKPSKSSRPRITPTHSGVRTKPGRTIAKVDSKKANVVIETARSYLGTPYRYGGTTRKGMDCSGLLFTSFKAIDLTIPRTSYEQANMGKAITIRSLQPGDLVFFSEKKGGNKVSHVGLVTAVRSDEEIIFIHSTTHKGVMEDDLFSDHYRKIFIKAVRPFE
jgi:probable lipoprotein NlpC